MQSKGISKQFGVFRFFAPPVNKAIFKLSKKFLSTPAFIFKDKRLEVEEFKVESYDGFLITVYMMTPSGLKGEAPCLVDFHGGGFVFEGSFHHYRLAMEYALKGNCKVIYVKYRLAPEYKFPVPMEDCYAVTKWVYDNADKLGIDKFKIAVGGDSAGGTLAAAVCQMNRDRGNIMPLRFQMLIYPFLDMRNNSASCKKYTNTPMWNSTLSNKVKPYLLSSEGDVTRYASPVEADDFSNLPDAYIETAEFDCLHDDGILYGKLLKESGADVCVCESKGTMHGFDIVLNAPMSRKMIDSRTEYIRNKFR